MKGTTRAAALLVWLLVVSYAVAQVDLTIYPPEGEAVGAVTSATEGWWIVFRAAPFGVVPSRQITIAGQAGCLWTGTVGTYTAVLIPSDQTIPVETGTVVLGSAPEPNPNPNPNPDPDPEPPGPRTVVIIAEEDSQTAYREVAINVLRDYVIDNDHNYRLYDPDDKDSRGQTPALLREYLLAAEPVGLPALLVIDSKGEVTAVKLPDAGQTVQSAKAAGEAAIKILKDFGG